MIPIRLEIENFRSFHSPVEIALDFAPLFCIVGDNGAGKTSIIEAMLWALFGIARKKGKANSAIRTGENYASVQFEFETPDGIFRVIRKHSVKGKTTLQLHRLNDGEWTSTTDSHRNTDIQSSINRTLGANYDDFCNATVFMQNESSQFSLMQPSARRKLLSNILGMERFQKIRDKAAEYSRGLIAEAQALQSELYGVQEKLARIPDVGEQITVTQKEIEDEKERLDEISKRIEEVSKQLMEMEIAVKKRKELVDKLSSLDAEISESLQIEENLKNEIDSVKKIISNQSELEKTKVEYDSLVNADREQSEIADKYNSIQNKLLTKQKEYSKLKEDFEKRKSALQGQILQMNGQLERILTETTDFDAVKSKVEELDAAKTMLNDLQSKKERYEKLSRRIEETQIKIEAEKEKLNEQLIQKKCEREKLEKELSSIPDNEKELIEIRGKISGCEQAQQKANQLQSEISKLELQLAELFQKKKALLDIFNEREEQKKFVQSKKIARCPRCGSELSGKHKEELIAKLNSEQDEIRKQGLEIKSEIEKKEENNSQLKKEMLYCKSEYSQIKQLQERENVCITRIALASKSQEQHNEIEKEIAESSKVIVSGDFSKRWRAELSKTHQELNQLGFIPESLFQAQKMVDELLPFEKRLAVIIARRKDAGRLRRELNDAKNDLNKLENDDSLSAFSAELEKLNSVLGGTKYNVEKHQAIRKKLKSLEDFPKRYFELQNALKNLPALEKQKDALALKISSRKKDCEKTQFEIEQISSRLIEEAELEKLKSDLLLQNSEAQEKLSEMNRRKNELDVQNRIRQDSQKDEKRISSKINDINRNEKSYSQVDKICGPLGIQDWLMQRYLSMLEDYANEILETITDGEFSVRLIPEEGEKLKVQISDKYGEKPYESYSGGEEFRIDFALRLAISRLLANRAGFPLRTLIIDEGFGSQDEKGISRLVETLYDIQSQFDRIIVITHLPSLRNSFPARIVVTKNDDGSNVAME